MFEQPSQRGAAELESGDPEAVAATLRTALALWRGPALADLPGAGGSGPDPRIGSDGNSPGPRISGS
ncbi:BTAD domain-containing putative transcriptional regulator [Streptomyces sp. NBC_00842]|uniref:BTAD domain-containing putative transcriptional regulator n=1 Tax=unclassified Streptomyces TaxID=2593676 RepID=UPI003869DDFE